MLISRASFVTFDGFEVQNSRGRGISVFESTSITVRNCYVHHVDYRALGGSGDNLMFENNEVAFASLMNAGEALGGGGGWPAAVSSYMKGDAFARALFLPG